MNHIICVKVIPCGFSPRIDAECKRALSGTHACARSFECGEVAVASAHEAMSNVIRVEEGSCNPAFYVDAIAGSALARTSSCPRCVEIGDGPVRLSHKAVVNAICISRISGDFSLEVKARYLAANEGARASRRVKGRNGATGRTHKTVRIAVRVEVVSCSCSFQIDAARNCALESARTRRL